MNTFPKRGEVWWMQFPDDPKVRPALIVSINLRNEFGANVLAVPLTTNLRPSPAHVYIPKGHAGLRANSMAKCENVALVNKSRMTSGGKVGEISPAIMTEIEKALMRALGIQTP